MSLLLLKTRDLTWQDHTLNTEVMLAPARSGLLLNKHKTLGAKCEMDKQLYERQRAQCIKDFQSSRRLIDRQRQKLIQRQKELGTKTPRVRSAAVSKPATETAEVGATKERSVSAPGGFRSGLPAIYIDTGAASPDPSESSSFFVTECAPTPLPSYFPTPSRVALTSTPISGAAGPSLRNRSPSRNETPPARGKTPPSRDRTPTRNKTPTRNMTPIRTRTPTRNPTPTLGAGRDSAEPRPPLQQRSVSMLEKRLSRDSKPSHSVRFAGPPDDGDDNDDDDRVDGGEVKRDAKLEARVRAFIADIDDFTLARKQGREAPRRPRSDIWPSRRSEPSTPIVAKRYNTWNLDQKALLNAFDQFCQMRSPEELTKAMRLAAKMKANIKVTRNQSIVPSVATYRSTRAFRALLSRQHN